MTNTGLVNTYLLHEHVDAMAERVGEVNVHPDNKDIIVITQLYRCEYCWIGLVYCSICNSHILLSITTNF